MYIKFSWTTYIFFHNLTNIVRTDLTGKLSEHIDAPDRGLKITSLGKT